jgi:hypothetical protein
MLPTGIRIYIFVVQMCLYYYCFLIKRYYDMAKNYVSQVNHVVNISHASCV